jgi:hypothetical protein
MKVSDSDVGGWDEEFSALFSTFGWAGRVTSEEVVERWRTFGGDCIDGYPWDIEDYLNDLTLRNTLQKVESPLREISRIQVSSLMREIYAVDATLQAVFQREVFLAAPEDQWWMRRAPTYAARDFCREFEQSYRVKVRPMSKFDDDVDAMKRILAEEGELVDVFLKVRKENWYVAQRPGLFFRACKNSTSLPRSVMGTLWSWVSGELSDVQLRSAVNRNCP